jgi:hypothetical protein
MISKNLSIPGFDVRVGNNGLSCQVKSQDGRYTFSAKINEDSFIHIRGDVYGVVKVNNRRTASFKDKIKYIQYADDLITQAANALKLVDKLSSDGFSAKINRSELVLSHSSKQGYSLVLDIEEVRRIDSPLYPSLYAEVKYLGPAYEDKGEKWKYRGYSLDTSRLVAIDQDLDKFAEGLKARVLSLGDEKHLIPQWGQEMQAELQLQGFTSTIDPKEGIVKFSHPGGLSGSLALTPHAYWYDFSQKYRDSDFPNDIIEEKEVLLLTYSFSNDREPKVIKYDNNPHEIARAIAELAEKYVQARRPLRLVYEEISKSWNSDTLVPKLRNFKLLLVNPRLIGNESIILELTREEDKLVLRGMGEERSYPMANTTTEVDVKAITQDIVALAEKYVQLNRAPELVYEELSKSWKSDVLVPKLRDSKLLLVNPELDGNDSIILELNQDKNKLVLRGMREERSYPMANTTTEVDVKAINQDIVALAEKYVQKSRSLELVYKELSKSWKSDTLVPKLRSSKLLLVNTEIDGHDSIILELTRKDGQLRLTGKDGYTNDFVISNTGVDAKAVTQVIVGRVEKYLQLRRDVTRVYREVCNKWKSNILVPKLNDNTLKLVNTELDGDEAIISELFVENDKLVLKDKENSYEISKNPGEIAQTIVGLAEKHVKEFIQETGYIQPTTIVQEVPELDF